MTTGRGQTTVFRGILFFLLFDYRHWNGLSPSNSLPVSWVRIVTTALGCTAQIPFLAE